MPAYMRGRQIADVVMCCSGLDQLTLHLSAYQLVERPENYFYKVARQIDTPRYGRAKTPYETNEKLGITRVFDHGGTFDLRSIVTHASGVAEMIGLTGPELIKDFTEALSLYSQQRGSRIKIIVELGEKP
jgi:hypothetical protein